LILRFAPADGWGSLSNLILHQPMVKRITYHATSIHDKVYISYDDHGVRRHVEHQLPSQPVGDPLQLTQLSNMSRKDR
jgi:hypothetical protein